MREFAASFHPRRSRYMVATWALTSVGQTIGFILVVAMALAGCGQGVGTAASASKTPGPDYGATATPYGQRAVPTLALTPPPGWSPVLSGLQFTNTSTHGALVASAARPGRVIGCGMSTPIYQPTPPIFVLSNDGGQTWQTRTIPNLPSAQGCDVLADTLQPDTFAVEPEIYRGSLYVTRDAGVTWKALELPLLTRPIGLAGGQLFAVANRAYGQPGTLLQASLTTGSWRTIATNLPEAGSDPYAAVMDPDNPAVIYLSGFSRSTSANGTGCAVYRTTDGGASWQLAHLLPSARHIALYTAHQQQVIAEQVDAIENPQQLSYSADGGTTWQDSSIGAGDLLWVSPQGRTYTESWVATAPMTDTLYALDPAHGTSKPIGTYTLGPGPGLLAVVDGPAPALLYATPDQIWRLPLST